MPIFDRFNKTNAHSLNHQQKLDLEIIHLEIGAGFVNKSCGSCINHMLTLIWNNYREHRRNVIDYTNKTYQELVKIAVEQGYSLNDGRKKKDIIKYLDKI